MSISRNSPCPCGSGKKYKRCCMDKETSAPVSTASFLAAEVAVIAEEQEVDSIEQLNEIAAEINYRRNHAAREDFLGLSPDQMQRFLYSPFSSPEIVSFSDHAIPQAEVLILFNMLVKEIGEVGVKATANGNLPLKLCQKIHAQYDSDFSYKLPRIRSEVEFESLHCVRLIAVLAKLIRKKRGR